jgi:glycosyltransferase involved in cell wall biosynthesis
MAGWRRGVAAHGHHGHALVLAILTSHPIQYQAPLWRALHAAGIAPIKVWFLSDHGTRESRDVEFGRAFTWDLDLLSGYPHEFLPTEPGADLRRFRGVRLREPIESLLRGESVTDLWVEGWRLKPLWDAVKAARRLGVRVWMRGESNDLKRDSWWKGAVKRRVLGRHLAQVDQFLCIGAANRRLYEGYGVASEKLALAPYAVDNDRFRLQAAELRPQRAALRRAWNIPEDAYCILFCGKFIAKKRPQDLVAAVKRIAPRTLDGRQCHLLFVGSGELGHALREACCSRFDAEMAQLGQASNSDGPSASFVGFLNQMEIAKAYVGSDVLVLPSDCGETWGLVVNEAMACGCPAVVSDQCGSAEDLPARLDPALVFRCGDVADLARALMHAADARYALAAVQDVADSHHIRHTVEAVARCYSDCEPESRETTVEHGASPLSSDAAAPTRGST